MNLKRIWSVGLYIFAAAWLMFFMVDDSVPVSFADDHNDTLPDLPASLAKYYPPEAESDVWYEYMVGMDQAFAATAVNLREGDMENALKTYKAFEEKYRNIANMVPEWSHYLDLDAFDVVNQGLANQDQAAVMGGLMRIANSCEECHHPNMARVTLLYRFKRMHELTVNDPVSGGPLPYKIFKQELSMNFNGIGTDLQEGQLPKALEHYEQFAQRFKALGDTCLECHEVERRYFVDPEMQKVVNSLGEQLKSEQPDFRKVGGMMQQIGVDTCGKCHMVHVPGSYAPYYIKTAN